MTMARRLLREGDARHGATDSGGAVTPGRCAPPAARLACRRSSSTISTRRGLIAYMQDERFSHSDLYRRAAARTSASCARAVEGALAAARGEGDVAGGRARPVRELHRRDPLRARRRRSSPTSTRSCGDTATARAGRTARRRASRSSPTASARHTASRARSRRSAQRGVAGFEIEVVGTDPAVDRRLSAVAEFEVPFYPGLQIGVPSLAAAVQTLADGSFDADPRLLARARSASSARSSAAALGVPLLGSYHTELTAYAGLRSGERAHRRGDGRRRQRLLRRLRPRALAQPGLRRGARRDRRRRRADRALGPRRRHRALRPGAARARLRELRRTVTPSRRSSTAVRRADHPREGRRPARRRVPARARAANPRLRLVLVGGGPEQHGCASASASTPASAAGSRATRWRVPTPTRRRLPVRRAAPTRSARSSSRRRPAGCR